MAENKKSDVLIVERDRETGRAIRAYLLDHGYAAEWVDSAEKAYAVLDERPFGALVAALSIGRADGLRVMAVAQSRNPDLCAVLIAEPAEISRATEGLRLGAHDYQTKPLNLDKLEAVIEHGLAYQRLAMAQTELHRRLDERFGLGNLIGRSRLMAQVYNTVRQVGPTDTPVLIHGEPGSGKRLIAQALHHNSPRRDAPFVSLECRGLPEVVVRAELFGYAVGRGIGNSPLRQGRFLLADKGTLYLAGLDTLSPALQSRLLETIETRKVPRPGDGKPVRIDVRFIGASDRRIDAMAESGEFSKPLYEGLNAVSIEAPALRKRREDIPFLLDRLLTDAAARHGKTINGLERDALDLMTRYDWPGNIRELENTVEDMVIAARAHGPLRVRDIPERIRDSAPAEPSEMRFRVGTPLAEMERIAIEETLKACGGDRNACAHTLGIGVRTLYRKLSEYRNS